MKQLALYTATALFLAACGQKPAEGTSAAATTTSPATTTTASTTTTAASTTTTQATAPATPKVSIAALAGSWRSTEDKSYMIEFKEGKLIQYSGKKALSTAPFELSADCKACKEVLGFDASMGCIVEKGTEEYCYVLVYFANDTLQYSMVGGRGNTLEFVRAK